MGVHRPGLVAVAIVTALAACAKAADDQVYQMPMDAAFERLVSANLRNGLGNTTIGMTKYELTRGRVPPDHVIWRVWDQGDELFRFDIRLTPEGEKRTRVAIEYKPVYKSLVKDSGAPANLIAAVRLDALATGIAIEQVAAILEDRAYSSDRAVDATRAARKVDHAAIAKAIEDQKAQAAAEVKKLDGMVPGPAR